MGRAPCCEKMGLNKGTWTPEEDNILISFIQKNGHANWRALPRQAGLLRCGKSCRLRWINYLRPDIKRGNFTIEEEEIIINLHETLGNRWAAIAAKLPGRTDNEIKNVWHAHLKKKLLLNSNCTSTPHYQITKITPKANLDDFEASPVSPQYSSSELSSSVTADSIEQFWVHEEKVKYSENRTGAKEEVQFKFPLFPIGAEVGEDVNACISRMDDDMDFWCDLVSTSRDGDYLLLPDF